MKWKMICYTEFESWRDGYNVVVSKSGLGWVWLIQKDGDLIDHAMYHPHPPTGELDAKVKAEKMLNRVGTVQGCDTTGDAQRAER